MLKTVRILLLLVVIIASGLSAFHAQAASPNTFEILTTSGIVNPILSSYLQRGIHQAETDGAAAVIIQLDTPGGLDSSMREIVQSIIGSRVPVVVYISPNGARAASAGVFITESAHIAAMATNTVIGAAHPVNLGPSGVQDVATDEATKIVNDAAAYMRTITGARGRNVDWTEQAVRSSVSVTETEALKLNVIDMVAPDLDYLLLLLDGKQVTLQDGSVVILHSKGAATRQNPMTGNENFLYSISDPNIAYLLLSVATLGIMVELSNPGLIFPGVIGAICLLMAFFSLGTLPVNYAGIGLMLLAFGLFIAEVHTGHGIFAAGGIISLFLGSTILFQGGSLFQVSPWLSGIITLIFAAFFVFLVAKVITARRLPASTGREELIGKPARVTVALSPEGMVLFRGERWKAVTDGEKVPAGENVIINKVDSLTLHVSRKTG